MQKGAASIPMMRSVGASSGIQGCGGRVGRPASLRVQALPERILVFWIIPKGLWRAFVFLVFGVVWRIALAKRSSVCGAESDYEVVCRVVVSDSGSGFGSDFGVGF